MAGQIRELTAAERPAGSPQNDAEASEGAHLASVGHGRGSGGRRGAAGKGAKAVVVKVAGGVAVQFASGRGAHG